MPRTLSIGKRSACHRLFNIILTATICVTLFLLLHETKRSVMIDLASCNDDDCLLAVFGNNISPNTSRKYLESLRNSSLHKMDRKPDRYDHCFCSHSSRNDTVHSQQECSFLLNRSVLIHQPSLLPHLQKTPCLLMDEWLSYTQPIYSVILTIWNQERIINQTLHALLKHTREWWELIVVFDQCQDQSIPIVENIIKTFMAQCSRPTTCCNPYLVHIRLINQISAVFETSSNNIGMRASHANVTYFIIVQDDMIVRQDGWNCILAIPMRLYTDVFSVSGRCAHRSWTSNSDGQIGRCGTDIDFPLSMSCADRSAFHVRDTGNRGPLLLHAARTRWLGYLDETNYWLGDDDHDINFRAYASNRWVAGFQPIDFDAPLEFGGTRRQTKVPMTAEDIKYKELRTAQRNQQLGARLQFEFRLWRHINVTIKLSPNLPDVNLQVYMQDKKNYNELAIAHDETRRFPNDTLLCKD